MDCSSCGAPLPVMGGVSRPHSFWLHVRREQMRLGRWLTEDEEFDLLVLDSSLGTPVVRARIASVPPEVHARFEAHLTALGYGTSGGVVVTDVLVGRLAGEAEAGYEVSRLRTRGG